MIGPFTQILPYPINRPWQSIDGYLNDLRLKKRLLPLIEEIIPDVKPDRKGAPYTKFSKLQNLMDNIYKGTRNPNRASDGTLADAVRYEHATGGTVGGRTHTIKAEETLAGLQNWLDRNPHALQVDRQEAITQIQSLKTALGK